MNLSITNVQFYELLRRLHLFYDRLLELCESAGIKPTTLLSNMGMSKGSLANWKDGKLPTGEVLVRFSEHFGVTMDYLALGKKPTIDLSGEDQEILSLFHQLPRDAQLEFRGELKGYLKCLDKQPTAPDKDSNDIKMAK